MQTSPNRSTMISEKRVWRGRERRTDATFCFDNYISPFFSLLLRLAGLSHRTDCAEKHTHTLVMVLLYFPVFFSPYSMIVPTGSETFFLSSFNTHSHFLPVYCVMLGRTSEQFELPCSRLLSSLDVSRRKELQKKNLLGVAGTRDKKKRRLRCLDVRAYAFSHYCYLSS